MRPVHQARRRELEAVLPGLGEDLAAAQERLAPILAQGPALEVAAERAAAAAPSATVWPMVRRRQHDFERDLDASRRGARARDVDDATHRNARARHDHQLAQRELVALHGERERRADLRDLRELERAARAEHARRQRAAATRPGDPTRPMPALRREHERRQAYRPPLGRGVDRGVDRGPGLSR
ncbi:hypothetical protein ACIHFD_32780 [Nonomuraea sp. NPDC051941]|uniref:hypothetical protein n=1 Tax=Nonomuraea sp. NPDC051941 TaxID=3364373 RepID=UPI0037C83ED1